VHDRIHAATAAEHEHDVGRLHASLQAETAAGHGDETGVGPGPLGRLDDDEAVAAAAADHETGLDDIGNDGYGVRFAQQVGRDAPVRRLHDFVDDADGFTRALGFGFTGQRAGGGEETAHEHQDMQYRSAHGNLAEEKGGWAGCTRSRARATFRSARQRSPGMVSLSEGIAA
jgi:hypothetical protein